MAGGPSANPMNVGLLAELPPAGGGATLAASAATPNRTSETWLTLGAASCPDGGPRTAASVVRAVDKLAEAS